MGQSSLLGLKSPEIWKQDVKFKQIHPVVNSWQPAAITLN